MTRPVTIRKYERSDYDACRSLWVELTQRHRDIYKDPAIGGDDPGSGFDDYLADERLRGPWVAVVDEEVVGLTGLFVKSGEAEVEPVVVSSPLRSQGIGGKLVSHAREEAVKLDCSYLNVRPVGRNIEAIAFFVESGFDVVGHIQLFQELRRPTRKTWKLGLNLHGKNVRY